jgi:hypothetical protein
MPISLNRFLAILVLLACCGPSRDNPTNLLNQRAPIDAHRVTNPERITDGIEAEPGDNWQTNLTSRFLGTLANVTYDFGESVRIRAAYLQADNNDTLTLSAADATGNFHDVWTAPPASGSGMRARHTNQLDFEARYLRLRFESGDGRFSVSELQVFAEPGADWPPELAREKSVAPELTRQRSQRNVALLWALVLAALLLIDRRNFPLPVRIGEGVIAVAVTVYAVIVFAGGYPAQFLTVAFVKAMVTLVAAAALVRLALWRKGADRRIQTIALGVAAFVAIFAFYNLGQPQFFNAGTGAHSFIHTWDMRVYYPTVKYFDELGYDGLYWASAKAYLEDTGTPVEQLAGREVRDLRDYSMTTMGAARAEIDAIKNNFSSDRWEAFKKDMAYFRVSMGGGYLESMGDHGANATPAWMLAANLIYRWTTANDTSLLIGGLLDPLLLLVFLVAAVRAFGWRTALVCMIVFGTSSFPMHGSNWAGSTLRNDWMVLLGLSLCAFKTERWMLGGGLLGWSAMIRAFPALGVAALALPTLWWGFESWRTSGRPPRLAEIREARRPLLRAATGVIIAAFVLGSGSAAMFGVERGWVDWASKISAHASKPNINHVGLRTVLTYEPEDFRPGEDWVEQQRRVHQSRKPIILLTGLIFLVACVIACREVDSHQAVITGMLLLPMVFYPSNYYLHFIFVVPALAADRSDEGIDWRWAGTGRHRLALGGHRAGTAGDELHRVLQQHRRRAARQVYQLESGARGWVHLDPRRASLELGDEGWMAAAWRERR